MYGWKINLNGISVTRSEKGHLYQNWVNNTSKLRIILAIITYLNNLNMPLLSWVMTAQRQVPWKWEKLLLWIVMYSLCFYKTCHTFTRNALWIVSYISNECNVDCLFSNWVTYMYMLFHKWLTTQSSFINMKSASFTDAKQKHSGA